MQVAYFNSLLRVFKKLPGSRQTQINSVIAGLVFCLENKTAVSSGVGLKKLSLRLWEARAGIDLRVVFSIDSDALNLVFAGNHDEIKKYLKPGFCDRNEAPRRQIRVQIWQKKVRAYF